MPDTITTLRGLLERATKGPWTFRIFGKGKRRAFDIQGFDGPCVVGWPGFDDSDRSKAEHDANGSLIVAAVNALPALLAVAEAAKQIDSLIEGMALSGHMETSSAGLCELLAVSRRLRTALANLETHNAPK